MGLRCLYAPPTILPHQCAINGQWIKLGSMLRAELAMNVYWFYATRIVMASLVKPGNCSLLRQLRILW